MSISYLEGQRGILRIILYLLENGEVNRDKINRELTGSSLLTNRSIERLTSLGLVEIKWRDIGKMNKLPLVYLSKKGREVAELLKKVSEKLPKELPED